MLSLTHTDTTASAVARGSLIVADATPKWYQLTVGGGSTYLRSDGVDVGWSAILVAELPIEAMLHTLADAKGDLLVADQANNFIRVAVGTNGQFLKANSAAISGVEWGAGEAAANTLLRAIAFGAF